MKCCALGLRNRKRLDFLIKYKKKLKNKYI
jgi:hypothetical protein